MILFLSFLIRYPVDSLLRLKLSIQNKYFVLLLFNPEIHPLTVLTVAELHDFYDNTKKIRRELKEYGIPCYRVHASGHATPHDLINFISEVTPRYLVPIHTEHLKFFEKLFQNLGIKVNLFIFRFSY